MVHGRLVTLAWIAVALVGSSTYAGDDSYADLPDPTRPLRAEPVRSSDGEGILSALLNKPLTLTSIVLGAETRFAIINGRRLKEGDVVDGARVNKISAHEVWIERNGAERALRLLTTTRAGQSAHKEDKDRHYAD